EAPVTTHHPGDGGQARVVSDEAATAASLKTLIERLSAPEAPDDVPQNDVTIPNGPASPASLPEQHGAPEIKSCGPAPPSTLEAYLDRWTQYFATDPCWHSVYCAARGDSEPDPLAHHIFCRRLAAALAPTFVEPHGAPTIKSWGPAP